jgi:hypothetical protein
MAASLYSLGTVCLRNIRINTLHNGDDDDDDDSNRNTFNTKAGLRIHLGKSCRYSLRQETGHLFFTLASYSIAIHGHCKMLCIKCDVGV